MKIETAMLLAAGRGERLRPLTDTIPKPLLPVAGKPMIAHHLLKLSSLGVKKVVINVSYLAKQIMDALGDGRAFGLHIEYSYEKEALGAGGGIHQALPMLGDGPVLLMSSDIYSHFPLGNFFDSGWELGENLLHCVLTKNFANASGDFGLTEEGKLTLCDNPPYTYASIAVLKSEIFANQSPGRSGVMPAFSEAIHAGRATGEVTADVLNVNTFDEYQPLA